jgi:hypothetical protein
MDEDPKQNIEILTKFYVVVIEFNWGPFILNEEISHLRMIWEVGHTIECNNVSELQTPDNGRVRPKHVGRREADNNKLDSRQKYCRVFAT